MPGGESAATQSGLEYAVDLFVLCIDKTGSMSPVIDMVKTAATRLHHDSKVKLDEKGKPIKLSSGSALSPSAISMRTKTSGSNHPISLSCLNKSKHSKAS